MLLKTNTRKKCIHIWCIYECNPKFSSIWLHSAHHGNTKEEECWITASRVRGTLHEQRMERHHTSWNQRGPALRSRVSTQNVFGMENPMDLQNPQETRAPEAAAT